jgi:hypothetical protein
MRVFAMPRLPRHAERQRCRRAPPPLSLLLIISFDIRHAPDMPAFTVAAVADAERHTRRHYG